MNCILYGTGDNGKIAYEYLKDKVNILAVSSPDQQLWGKKLWGPPSGEGGVTVIAPSSIPKEEKVVIATGRRLWTTIIKELDALGLESTPIDAFIFDLMQDRICIIHDQLLEDEESKKCFREILKFRACVRHSLNSNIITDNAFFCLPEFKFCASKEKAAFVDAGAYVGDTLEDFLSNCLDQFTTIYAFEPGERQFKALKTRVARLEAEWALDKGRIQCVNAALGAENGRCTMKIPSQNLSCQQVQDLTGDEEQGFPVYALDEYVKERVDYIKADVEGSELRLLRGAKRIIQRDCPNLAICLYHNPQDYIEIPEYIHNLVPA